MCRFGRFLVIAISALTVAGCATMNVSSHVRSGIDFARYRTYDWGPADPLPTGDPRLDKSPFFRDHMMGAVEKQMAARGYVLATSGTPDLLIHYHASITQRLDVSGADRDRDYCDDDDCNGTVFSSEAGTIVLDVVEANTNRVIWRGWAQRGVEDVLDNQDRMARTINEAVTRMLARLPPTL